MKSIQRNGTITCDYTNVSFMCLRCYNVMPGGNFHVTINEELDPSADHGSIAINQNAIALTPSRMKSAGDPRFFRTALIQAVCPVCGMPMVMVDSDIADVVSALCDDHLYVVQSGGFHDNTKDSKNTRSFVAPFVKFPTILTTNLCYSIQRIHSIRMMREDGKYLMRAMEDYCNPCDPDIGNFNTTVYLESPPTIWHRDQFVHDVTVAPLSNFHFNGHIFDVVDETTITINPRYPLLTSLYRNYPPFRYHCWAALLDLIEHDNEARQLCKNYEEAWPTLFDYYFSDNEVTFCGG